MNTPKGTTPRRHFPILRNGFYPWNFIEKVRFFENNFSVCQTDVDFMSFIPFGNVWDEADQTVSCLFTMNVSKLGCRVVFHLTWLFCLSLVVGFDPNQNKDTIKLRFRFFFFFLCKKEI